MKELWLDLKPQTILCLPETTTKEPAISSGLSINYSRLAGNESGSETNDHIRYYEPTGDFVCHASPSTLINN